MTFESVYHKGRRHYRKGHKRRAAFYKKFCRIIFSCDIPFQADIADDVQFYHSAFGVVINANTVIKSGTIIQHGVTIGEISSHKAPVIGHNVYVGAKSTILGDITIGDNVKIGAGALVLQDVPDDCTAVGVPARIIPHKEKEQG